MRPTLEELRRVPTLGDLPEERLAWIAGRTEVRTLSDGEVLVRADEPAEHMHFLLDGQIEYEGDFGGQPVHWVVTRGEIAGMLPHSRMTRYASTGRAVGFTRVGLFPKTHFEDLRREVPELESRLLAVMTDRIRQAAQAEEQRERMSALGKLSAGLAHELGNPAAAVRSASTTLRGRLDALPTLLADWLRSGATPQEVALIEEVVAKALKRRDEPLTPLKRSELEDDIADWLADQGDAAPEERAGTLVEGGVRAEDLSSFASACGGSCAAGVAYLEFRLASMTLLLDVEHAAQRITDLVASVKRYSHMDRGGDRAETDVRTGLVSTLKMLSYKLRAKNIGVEKDFAPNLPNVMADEGALNQVWTNLVVNAVEALPPGGRVTLRAVTRPGQVVVSVIDDGPGIPPDIQARVFEPFFTTKGVGEGSGLGLDLVQRIVTRQHGGSLRLSSEPGRTEFQVLLPVAGAARETT